MRRTGLWSYWYSAFVFETAIAVAWLVFFCWRCLFRQLACWKTSLEASGRGGGVRNMVGTVYHYEMPASRSLLLLQLDICIWWMRWMWQRWKWWQHRERRRQKSSCWVSIFVSFRKTWKRGERRRTFCCRCRRRCSSVPARTRRKISRSCSSTVVCWMMNSVLWCCQ